MKPSELLKTEDKWQQGSYYEGDNLEEAGCYCLTGAMYACNGQMYSDISPMSVKLAEVILRKTDDELLEQIPSAGIAALAAARYAIKTASVNQNELTEYDKEQLTSLIIEWNDSSYTTYPMVKEALEQAGL